MGVFKSAKRKHPAWARKRSGRKGSRRVVKVDVQEIYDLLDATASGPLSPGQRERLQTIIELLLAKARGFRSSEKLEELLKEAQEALERDAGPEPTTAEEQEGANSGEPGTESLPGDKEKKPGHGRNGANKFTGAEEEHHSHESLKPGDACPLCPKGKLAEKEPGVVLQITGSAPIRAIRHQYQKLRCSLCGALFTAKGAEEFGSGSRHYDETVPAILAVLAYGNGFPRYRLQNLQKQFGIPLPQSTQWDLLDKASEELKPVYRKLVLQAARGDVLHSDDTTRKILSLERPPGDTRTGIFTTGVVSATASRDGPRIALFFTGRQHAGENLADVLKLRSEELAQPIVMYDALNRNPPKIDGVPIGRDEANCLSHGRRYFADLFERFPEKCHHVLEELGKVFFVDQMAKDNKLDPEERLTLHQRLSAPVMEELYIWMELQFQERHVEPNSGLGKAIKYLKNHWSELTLFLRRAGAPITNNLVERALKMAIRHRRNSHFFKTKHGAEVGDLFTSLVHTCELNEVDPFRYLTALLKHIKVAAESPAEWMPWNYGAALKAATAA